MPFFTGIISCGYIKFEGNIKTSPLLILYFNSWLKKANSPPSKLSFNAKEQETDLGIALNESVCSV